VLADVERNHRSWLARASESVELEGVTAYLGETHATLAFPRSDADLESAVRIAVERGVSDMGCWALAPDERLGRRLLGLGFQDGWQPHWMGIEPARRDVLPGQAAEETAECSTALPYGHDPAPSDVARHFVVRDGGSLVGHVVLHVEGDTGGIYDMGVAPEARRKGHGTALTLAAVAAAHELGCASVTLNATGEGELLYRSVGFASLGHGMTWWR
jgi:ribosomal protein S18 acetylase RimI-like enzyme